MSINKDKIDHLTHFKNIDNESDDYQRPGTIKERATSQIKKLNFLQTDQSKNVIKSKRKKFYNKTKNFKAVNLVHFFIENFKNSMKKDF